MVNALAEREATRDRPPRPELRLNLIGTVLATTLALAVYFTALLGDWSIPHSFSGVLFAVAPVCAIPATVLLAVRARAEQDESLRAVTGGLAVACLGMVLQLLAFRPISTGGGVFGTSPAGSSLLYLMWHAALPAGALASTIGRPRRARRWAGVAFGVVVLLLCATAVPESWRLVRPDNGYAPALVGGLLGVIVFTGLVLIRWVGRTGLRPTATRGWITIAMVLSMYDVAINALGRERFSDVWWASLTMRGVTYAVLLGGLIVSTAGQLQRLERYTSVELARAEGEVSNWAEVTERLLAATSALSAAVTADDVAVLLTAAGAGAIEADEAAIYLADRDQLGRFRVVGGVRGQLDGAVDAVPGTAYTEVMLSRTPAFLENAGQIARAFPNDPSLAAARPVQSLVALPLVAGDVSIGALVLSAQQPREFRGLARELLSALVRVGAQALQRALLFEQQSSLASTLQAALLPQSLPHRPDVDLIGRYLPATAGVDVGGDWYDVLELDDAKLLLVVGDVMGKGVPAATLMGQMRSAVRTLAAVDPDPAAILSGLDQLAAGFDLDSIVTLVIVALDALSGTALIANAGHLPPLVFAPGRPGEMAGDAADTDPPIGAPMTVPRASSLLQLSPGSALLLLTDGLVEERDGDLGERLDQLSVRAADLLGAESRERTHAQHIDLEQVADALAEPRVHRDDDVTILLARLRLPGSVGAVHGAAQGAASPAPVLLLDIRLDADLGAAALARRLVREAIGRGSTAVATDQLDAILLVTSELVTNGLRHGQPPVFLTLERRGSRMRLTVRDEGGAPPRPRVAAPDATSGRGLFLVAALASAWKIEHHPGERPGSEPGTSVWAEFELTGVAA